MTMLAPQRFACSGCEGNLGFDFTMAFQPIVDVAAGALWAGLGSTVALLFL